MHIALDAAHYLAINGWQTRLQLEHNPLKHYEAYISMQSAVCNDPRDPLYLCVQTIPNERH